MIKSLELINKVIKLHLRVNSIRKRLAGFYLLSFLVLFLVFILSINGSTNKFMSQQNVIPQTQADNVKV
ncbi:hypothetical protein AL507_01510 [Providencia stuartii]|nr:hypothetical protein AL507_01510 [Providencia stuartii]